MKARILRTGPILKNNEQGFTFLEILVVLVIMAVMMAVILPSFNRMFGSVQGVREGEKIRHLFEKARAEAILQAEPVGITFYTNGLCIFQLKGKIMEYQDLHMAVILEKEEKITQTFKPDGIASFPKLTFKTNEGTYVIYAFNPVSGKIEMERSLNL